MTALGALEGVFPLKPLGAVDGLQQGFGGGCRIFGQTWIRPWSQSQPDAVRVDRTEIQAESGVPPPAWIREAQWWRWGPHIWSLFSLDLLGLPFPLSFGLTFRRRGRIGNWL